MKTADEYNPPPGTTHVLAWIPGKPVPDFPDGYWALEALSGWLDPDLPERDEVTFEDDVDAVPDALGTQVAAIVGRLVRLARDDEEIGVAYGPFWPPFKGGNKVTRAICRNWPLRWATRPLYWVMPA